MHKWLTILLLLPLVLRSQIITTIAGTSTAGFGGDGGAATHAQLNAPTDVYKDLSGNIYIADRGNNRIRKVNASGTIITIGGNGVGAYNGDGGQATDASLNNPNGIAVDVSGNVYIADMGNNVVRMIRTDGVIFTIAGTGSNGFSGDGGAATSAEIRSPSAVAIDLVGNIYISDMGNSRIRKINREGVITTIAGGGSITFIQSGGYSVENVPATSVKLCGQNDVSVDFSGTVYITNYNCWHFSKITPDGMLQSVAGDSHPDFSRSCGVATQSNVYCPYGIYPDNLGNIYVCPRCNLQVRKINKLNYITTAVGNGTAGYSGDNGPAPDALVSDYIYGIYADTNRDVYFADVGNNVIRHFKALPDDTFHYVTCAESNVLLGADRGGTWKSSDWMIATVNDTGFASAHSPGVAFIKHATSDSCSREEVYVLTVGECNIGLPLAFSPNGDGNNDILYVRGGGIEKIQLRIYNRFGQMVFETNDMSVGWDGKFNGQEAPIDVYGYFLTASFKGYEKVKKGNITLQR